MTKQKNFVLILFLIIAMLCLCFNTQSFLFAEEDYGSNNMITNSYDVKVDVSDDNSYVVSETIEIKFGSLDNGSKHGIYRYIPETSVVSIADSDGVINNYNYNITITPISAYYIENGVVNTFNISEYSEDGYYNYRFGNEYSYVNGKTITYFLKYKYSVGYDRLEDADLFYFNLIGWGWQSRVDSFSFEINMPKDFEASNLYFYVGKYAQSNTPTNLISYTVLGKKISGHYLGTSLSENTAVTIKLGLPNDYYNNVQKFNYSYDIILIVLGGILLASAIAISIFYATKRKKIAQPVEFFPPDNLNPIGCGVIANGSVSSKDMVSLIIYWASKKFVKITMLTEKTFTITKLKELESNMPAYELDIFEKLFKEADVVATDTPKEEFAAALASGAKVENKSNNMVANSVKGLQALIFYLGYILLFVAVVIFGIRMKSYFDIILRLVLMILFSTPIFYLIKTNPLGFSLSKLKAKIFVLVAVIVATLLEFLFLTEYLGQGVLDIYGLIYIIPLICGICSILCFTFPYVNPEKELIFGRVMGFKDFLKVAEKDRLNILLKDNPSYFYDILPYAYIFGITKQYINKFEGMAIAQSEYFDYSGSGNMLSFIVFTNLFNNSLNKMYQTSMAQYRSTQAGSSGHGGFGGGFSGGGFGGGGGGSW